MSFKQYLAEQETARQVIQVPDSVSISDPQVRDTINQHLNHELTDLILSPQSGIQKIRRVLQLSGLDMPAIYEVETEGDELVFEVGQYFLYLIYYCPLLQNKAIYFNEEVNCTEPFPSVSVPW